jgi:hypothetical protein
MLTLCTILGDFDHFAVQKMGDFLDMQFYDYFLCINLCILRQKLPIFFAIIIVQNHIIDPVENDVLFFFA